MPATATKPKSKTKVTLQPLGDKVVVEREESQEKTAGGIYIPDAAKDKPTRGTIIAVGTGKLLDDGTRGEMQVKKGDRVLFTSYAPEDDRDRRRRIPAHERERHPGGHRVDAGSDVRVWSSDD